MNNLNILAHRMFAECIHVFCLHWHLGPTLAKGGTGFNVHARFLYMPPRTGPSFKVLIRKTACCQQPPLPIPNCLRDKGAVSVPVCPGDDEAPMLAVCSVLPLLL